MTIAQRALVDGVLCDVVCTGRFYDFLEKRDDRWGLVLRQPIYEKDRPDPVDPAARLDLDAALLARFPEGYRHLAYLQTRIGYTGEARHAWPRWPRARSALLPRRGVAPRGDARPARERITCDRAARHPAPAPRPRHAASAPRAQAVKAIRAGAGTFGLSLRTAYGSSSSIGLRKIPMPSISISKTSPARIHAGGLRAWPTPDGVPVTTRSPGSSVIPWVA